MTKDNETHSHSYGRDEVIKIINSVISQVQHSDNLSREAIFKELSELQAIIEDARRELGQANPGDIKDKHIPAATDELDEVVNATAEATGKIMDACEIIEEKTSGLTEQAGGEIAEQVTKIYEACSFQDITGQRITKVVTTLKTIEAKVEELMAVLGGKMPGGIAAPQQGAPDTAQKDSLLNGPQMPDKAITQEDIDKLLDSFD